MKKKKLLYIGHAYHNKTQSTRFLKDILEEKYDVEYFDFDPYQDDYNVFSSLKKKKYDVLVLFQIMPEIKYLKKNVSYKKGIFFPMYDGVRARTDCLWYDYRQFHIINFSSTLHQELLDLGFSSFYIQYFPKPAENINWGDDKSVFFWNRVSWINLPMVERLLSSYNFNHFHLHKALDPEHTFSKPSAKLESKLEISEWYEKREQMQADMDKAAIYIAPRLYEGIGMSFLEAMAHGRCVISPDNPTMNEYITDGFNGYLYNPDEVKPLKITKVKEIQKNTLQYMEEGYENWLKKKSDILNWIAQPVKINLKLMKKLLPPVSQTKFYLLGLEIIRFQETPNLLKIKLLGYLPLITVSKSQHKSRIKLWGIKLITIKSKEK